MKRKCYLTIYTDHWKEKLLLEPITAKVLDSLQEDSHNDYIDDVPGPVPCTVDDIFQPAHPVIIIEFEKEESELICDNFNGKPGAVEQILPKEITRVGQGHHPDQDDPRTDKYIIVWRHTIIYSKPSK